MIFAPISIRTLNRYDCLKKCISSLQQCTWADKTELYISVDFPPSEEYVTGYEKVVDYLNNGVVGFKNTYIYFQQKNLGVFENSNFVSQKIREKYDRFISLEDDIEVAKSFLIFCDMGLELFEDDDSIVAINASDYVWCGNNYTPSVRYPKANEQTVEKRQLLFHASAFWFKKKDCVADFCSSRMVIDIAFSIKKMHKLYMKSKTFFYYYLSRVITSKNQLPWNADRIVPIDTKYRSLFPELSFNYVLGRDIIENKYEFELHDQNIGYSVSCRIKLLIKYMFFYFKGKH